ncbi:MAG: hypothetical protein U1G08_04810 [Verrucomicrobiota bacterium]
MILFLTYTGSSLVAFGQVTNWFSPNGNGSKNGSDTNNPAKFTNYALNLLLDNPSLTNLVINFLPGDYMVGGTNIGTSGTADSIWIQGGTNRIVQFKGYSDAAGIRPRLYLGKINYTNYWTNDTPTSQWMFQQASSGGVYNYLKAISLENLVLDGNFKNLGAWTCDGNSAGYKSFAMQLMAESGRVKDVLIQGFGSLGRVPVSFLDNLGGVEAFPIHIFTFAEGQTNAFGDTHPWVIENVEVADFNGRHGGYGTVFMPLCLMPGRGNPTDPPCIIVRRCQLRGGKGVIASGTAGARILTSGTATNHYDWVYSGRIRFEDNVFLNSGTGFNLDTGSISQITYDNNAFLDEVVFGNLGLAERSDSPHNGISISNNIIRLVGRDFYRNYTDACIDDPATVSTDETLGIGRFETNTANGLTIAGGAGNITLAGNDFTTWSLASFFRPNPGEIANSVYRLIWSIPSNSPINCSIYAQQRNPVTNMVLSNNRLSTVGYEFRSFSNLPSATYSSFSTNTSSAYNDLRTAVTNAPFDFSPLGQIERVGLGTNGAKRLISVREVQIGESSYTTASNGVMYVKVRAVDHQLSAGGQTGTIPVSGITVCISNLLKLATGSQIALTDSKVTGTNGTVQFAFTNLGTINAFSTIRAWQDVGAANGLLDQYVDIWASGSLTLGTCVTVIADPDVADDKYTASPKRSRLKASRTGSVGSDLYVTINMRTNIYQNPIDSSDLNAVYGSSGSADYYIGNGSGVWTNTSGSSLGTIKIPAGSASATVEIIPISDNVTEKNIACFEVVADSLYGIAGDSQFSVGVFDGPLWTMYELSVAGGYTNILSFASGSSSGGTTNAVKVVGGGQYGYYYGTNWIVVDQDGVWTSPSFTFANLEIANFYSISDYPWVAVGAKGQSARVNQLTGIDFNLPDLAIAPSAAYAINRSGSFIGGLGTLSNGVAHPTYWTLSGGTWSKYDLSDGLSTNWSGEIRGVNSGFQAAGVTDAVYSGSGLGTIRVGFRSKASTAPVSLSFNSATGVGDLLHAPGKSGSQNLACRANFVNGSGSAVGGYLYGGATIHPAFWPNSSLASDSVPIALQTWAPKLKNSVVDLECDALCVNDSGKIVGWSSTTTNSNPTRAVMRFSASNQASDWIDLNDRHFTAGIPTNFVLTTANYIDNSGVIVANGTRGGSTFAVVLIPRGN